MMSHPNGSAQAEARSIIPSVEAIYLKRFRHPGTVQRWKASMAVIAAETAMTVEENRSRWAVVAAGAVLRIIASSPMVARPLEGMEPSDGQ
jgi:hypothetical protein